MNFSTILSIVLGQAKNENLTVQGSLHAFLMVGAEYFATKLADLNKALEANEKILDILNRIKALRNRTTHPPKYEPIPYPPRPSLEDYIKEHGKDEGTKKYNAAYDNWLTKKTYIDEQNKPENRPTAPDIIFTPEQAAELQNLRKELQAELDRLKEAGIEPNAPDGKVNLADRVKRVLDDLDGVFKEFDALVKQYGPDKSKWPPDKVQYYDKYLNEGTRVWLLDGRDKVGGDSGKYSENIGDAVTASETLNSNQKDLINQVMFVFEQFQKIAQSCLAGLHETVKSSAKQISKAT